MSIIKTHDVTLYGGNDIDIILQPLCDDHLPLLYKWNADPEVVYWADTDSDGTQGFGEQSVRGIYGSVSQNAICFLIEANKIPIGDVWLQNMNIPEVSKMYPDLDVRRIDVSVGEKEYWGKGIGTQFIGMMVDFAFYGENVDVLHCFVGDHNIRSARTLIKNGFREVMRKESESDKTKEKEEIHFALTKQEFIERRRVRIPPDKKIMFPLTNLQPSQLCISAGKLRLIMEWFNPADIESFDPIPVKLLDNKILMTDGHTRAIAAHLAGWENVPIYWDEAELYMRAYAIDIKWCDEENIRSPIDLAGRIVPHKDYERLWRKRCMEMAL